MSDENAVLPQQDEAVVPGSDGMPAPAPGGAKRKPTGLIVAGGVAALVLLVLLVGVLVFVFFFRAADPTESAKPSPKPAAGKPSVPTSDTAGAQGEGDTAAPEKAPAPVTNEDVFKFRDIFVALIEPVVESTAAPSTSTSASADASGTPSDEGTLVLQDIVSENGERKAVLVESGTTYTLGPGERIGDTPWQVLTVGASSVTMLYGDSQLVLTVGQGIDQK